jgi:hypothetical protein
MKNTIKVTIPFSFKGVEYTPSSTIDLDLFTLGDQTIDSVFQLVANENKIDNYSYEYEVLESATKFFSEPTGLAGDYLSDNQFDLVGFKQGQKQSNINQVVQQIATEFLEINNLDDVAHKDIQQALIKAYQAGFKDNV